MSHLALMFIEKANNSSPTVSDFLTEKIVHYFWNIYLHKKYDSKWSIAQ